LPTCEQIWDAIAARRVVSIESAKPPIKPAPIIALGVPATTVVHMDRTLWPEAKGEPPEQIHAVMVLRPHSEPLVILREDLEGNEP
jgi:hypothetical protein